MKKLREGFTTGSCAAAAALAACLWQRDGFCPDAVELEVPGGKIYRPDIVPHEDGSCGIYKDSGDDPDITNGMEIVSRVAPAICESPKNTTSTCISNFLTQLFQLKTQSLSARTGT